MMSHRLSWVDDFMAGIKPHVFLRLSDNVLIRMPNEAFKLNTTGARVIYHILQGGSAQDFIKVRSDGPETERQLERFFLDFSLMWNHRVCENYRTPAVQRSEFAIGYITLPVLSEMALTYHCNIKCRFCYASCSETKNRASLPPEGFMKVLDCIRHEAEVPSVSFTGGEPLLYRELPKLIKYAVKSKGMRVNLITNGTLVTPQKAKTLARAGLWSAQVSIESAYAQEHDALTGTPGSHAASLKGIASLKAAGIRVHPHITICSVNRPRVADYPAFCRNLGMERFSANLVIPAGRGNHLDLRVSYSEIGRIVEGLKAASQAEGIEFMWYSPTPVCLFNPLAKGFGNKGCSACEGLLSVDPQGNVLPCSSWPDPVGNLLEEGFSGVWFKEKSREIRGKGAAPEECRKCRHFAACQGACPLYFRVHGCDELNRPWESMGLNKERIRA